MGERQVQYSEGNRIAARKPKSSDEARIENRPVPRGTPAIEGSVSEEEQKHVGKEQKLAKELRRIAKEKRKAERGQKRAEKREARRLRSSLFTVYSFPKSGRTWLSHLWFFYSLGLTGEEEPPPTSFRDVKAPLDSRWYHGTIIPACVARGLSPLRFTHDMAPGDDEQVLEEKIGTMIASEPHALIVRRPAKVMESYFHHARNRRKDNAYLIEKGIADLGSFIRDERYGVDRLLDYYSVFAKHNSDLQIIVYYEDMLADAAAVVRALLEHAGHAEVDAEALVGAVESARFERMQERERNGREVLMGITPDRDEMRSRVGGDGPGQLSAEDRAYIAERVEAANIPLLARYAQ